MNSKPNNTAELIKQLMETDKTIKVSDVAVVVSGVFAESKSNVDGKKAMTGAELSLRLFSMLSAIMVGITIIGMAKEEATELAMRIIAGDLQKMIEPEPGGEA